MSEDAEPLRRRQAHARELRNEPYKLVGSHGAPLGIYRRPIQQVMGEILDGPEKYFHALTAQTQLARSGAYSASGPIPRFTQGRRTLPDHYGR